MPDNASVKQIVNALVGSADAEDATNDTSTSTATARRRHDRLVDRAEDRDLVDVAYRIVDSPVGELLLATSRKGLVRVAFKIENHDEALEDLATRVSPRILEVPRRLDPVARQLDEFLAGKRHHFDLVLDMSLARGFRLTVLHQLQKIAYGQTASYAAIAAAAGSPSAMRAVGTACATNPLPLVIPCHRVVRSDGTTGQYGGGPETKRALLAMEAESPSS